MVGSILKIMTFYLPMSKKKTFSIASLLLVSFLTLSISLQALGQGGPGGGGGGGGNNCNVNISVSPNDTICLGSTLTLNATGANSYVWSFNSNPGGGGSLSATSGSQITATFSSVGQYTIEVDGDCGNQNDISTIVITVVANPTISLNNPLLL